MLNTKHFIFGLLLIFCLAFPRSAEAGVLDKCKLKPFDPVKSDTQFTNLQFRLAFEKARNNYHDYVNCVFNEAAQSMLGSAGPKDAKALNQPSSACIEGQVLTTLLKDTSPKNLLDPLLTAYTDYSRYLKSLISVMFNKPEIDPQSIGQFELIVQRQQFFELLTDNEIENALVALDSAFIGYKEMRQAYVLHVQFQCMLKNLERYRQAMSSLRSVISILPHLFEDASMHK